MDWLDIHSHQNQIYHFVWQSKACTHYCLLMRSKPNLDRWGTKLWDRSCLSNEDKLPLPIHFVTLKQNVNNADAMKITSLLNCKVKIETPHKKKGLAQCQKCQSFGHTKANCFNLPACVKCGEEHLTADCTLQKDTELSKLKCALCQSTGHPANYWAAGFTKRS